MTNVIFSIDNELHKKMKEHPEIKWTEVLRQSIRKYLEKVEVIDTLTIKDFRKQLNPEILKVIEELDETKEENLTKKIKKKEKERINELQEIERRSNK